MGVFVFDNKRYNVKELLNVAYNLYFSLFLSKKPMCVTSLFSSGNLECGGGFVGDQNSSFLHLLWLVSCGEQFCQLHLCIEVSFLNIYFVHIDGKLNNESLCSWWIFRSGYGCFMVVSLITLVFCGSSVSLRYVLISSWYVLESSKWVKIRESTRLAPGLNRVGLNFFANFSMG